MERIKSYFNGNGNVIKKDKDSIQYVMTSVKQISEVLLPHRPRRERRVRRAAFDKYGLKTQKLADYILFKKVIELINNKQHLSKEGLHKIIAIKASMNKGLPEKILNDFKGIIEPAERLLIEASKDFDPN